MQDVKLEDSNTEHSLSRHLTEGVVIIIATATAYSASYLYELRFNGYYGIPSEFIEVNIQNIIVFFCCSLVACLMAMQIGSFFPSFFLNQTNKEAAVFYAKNWYLAVMAIIGLVLSNFSYWFFLMISLFFFGPSIVNFLRAASKKPKIDFTGEFKIWVSTRGDNFLIYKEFPVRRYYLILGCISVVLALCLAVGRLTAINKTNYSFLAESSEVVLTRYGDRLVLGKLEQGSGKILPEFRLATIADIKGSIVTKWTGPIEAVTPIWISPKELANLQHSTQQSKANPTPVKP